MDWKNAGHGSLGFDTRKIADTHIHCLVCTWKLHARYRAHQPSFKAPRPECMIRAQRYYKVSNLSSRRKWGIHCSRELQQVRHVHSAVLAWVDHGTSCLASFKLLECRLRSSISSGKRKLSDLKPVTVLAWGELERLKHICTSNN